MSYDVNTFWRLRRWSVFPTNSTWDCTGQGHIRRVNILVPATNHSMITSQTESSVTNNDRSIPPLHSPVDRDWHSASLNWPNDDLLTNNTLHIACLYPPQGHQVNNMKAGTMRLVTEWVQIEEYDIYPVILSPSSDTKGKHRIDNLNTRDDTIIITITIRLY